LPRAWRSSLYRHPRHDADRKARRARGPVMGGETIKAGFRGAVGAFSLDAAFEIPRAASRRYTAPPAAARHGAPLHRRSQPVAPRVLRHRRRHLAGRVVVPPDAQRPIGYVFQEASCSRIFRCGAICSTGESAKTRRRAGRHSLDEVVELLGLARCSIVPRNSPVARPTRRIGRALLSQPRLMLMDEPLAALDRQAKDEILPFSNGFTKACRCR